jgi:hypothetical protein
MRITLAFVLLLAASATFGVTPRWASTGLAGNITGFSVNDDGSVVIAQRETAAREAIDPVRTLDRGQTWLPFTVLGVRPNRFFSVPSDPKVFYAVSGGVGSAPSSLYRTRDRGDTWELMAGAPLADDGVPLGNFRAGASPDLLYASRMARAFCNTGVCTYSGTGAHRSADGGRTWVRIETGLEGDTLALHPSPSDPRVVYATSYSSIHRSDDQGKLVATGAANADRVRAEGRREGSVAGLRTRLQQLVPGPGSERGRWCHVARHANPGPHQGITAISSSIR